MKKIIVALLLALMAVGAQAQLVTSISSIRVKERKERVPIKVEWYAKAGVSLMQANPGNLWVYGYKKPSGNKMKIGFNLGVGMLSHFRPSRPSNFYWGVELGLSQVGGGWNSEVCNVSWDGVTKYLPDISFSYFGAYLDPTIGWKKSVSENIKINVHLAPQIGVWAAGYDKRRFEYEVVTNRGHNYSESSYIDLGNPTMSVEGGIGIWFKRFIFDVSYRRIMPIGQGITPSNIILSVGVNF